MYLRARLGLAICRRKPSVFRKMTAAENILAVLEMMGLRRREQMKRVEELLQEFGIEHVRNTRGDSLSGGERRRTEIARALALSRSSFFSTSRLRVSTPKRWTIFRE
jgi:lipopolysaccharide export system ATP-binding protein